MNFYIVNYRELKPCSANFLSVQYSIFSYEHVAKNGIFILILYYLKKDLFLMINEWKENGNHHRTVSREVPLYIGENLLPTKSVMWWRAYGY